MMDYFITCTAISIFVWLAVILLKNAPAKISFYLMMFALVSWFCALAAAAGICAYR